MRETRTNTPLQALTLLNDVTYVEAARGAGRAGDDAKAGDARGADRAGVPPGDWPARRATTSCRSCATASSDQLARFRATADAAEKLLGVGEAPRDDRLDAGELAAYTAVASVILNLDEAVTKE